MSKGFITIAHNRDGLNFYHCAIALANSIRLSQSDDTGITLMVPRGQRVPRSVSAHFEHVVRYEVGEGEDDITENAYTKTLALDYSPYDQSIVLDADMLVPVDMTGLWPILQGRDMLFSMHATSFRGKPFDEDTNPYSLGLRDNRLPIIYSKMFYFEKTDITRTVFELAREIARGWGPYRSHFIQGALGTTPKDDTVFACALRDTGYINEATDNHADWFSFVHMKMKAQDIVDADTLDDRWAKQINARVRLDGSLIVGGYLQTRPFHYHDRDFMDAALYSSLENM